MEIFSLRRAITPVHLNFPRWWYMAWQKMSLQSNTGLTSLIVRNGACPYWVIDMFKRDSLSQCPSPRNIVRRLRLKLRENYFQPAAGEFFWGGAGVSSPDLWKINYLGHSMTWDKSGILRANQWLGPSQVYDSLLYIIGDIIPGSKH